MALTSLLANKGNIWGLWLDLPLKHYYYLIDLLNVLRGSHWSVLENTIYCIEPTVSSNNAFFPPKVVAIGMRKAKAQTGPVSLQANSSLALNTARLYMSTATQHGEQVGQLLPNCAVCWKRSWFPCLTGRPHRRLALPGLSPELHPPTRGSNWPDQI